MTNRKRRLPLGLIAAGLLGTLAVMGVVSGLWSKNLIINGSVETGDVNIDWTASNTQDEGCFPDVNPLFPCNFPRKDVGQAECLINDLDAQILTLRATNTYPSFDADCEVEFTNTGSIPVNFVGYAIVPGSGLTGCSPVQTETETFLVVDCDQLTIRFNDGTVGQQMEPGDLGTGSMKIHTRQQAEQSDCTAGFFEGIPGFVLPTVIDVECDPATLVNYEFNVKFCFAQWNEVATYDQCATSLQHEGPGGPGGLGDPDYDNVIDPADNCPTKFNPPTLLNPLQVDTDADGEGDACDPDGFDDDGDTIVDG